MKKSFLDYSKTGRSPKLFLDYLGGEEEAKAFYEYPYDAHSFKKVITDFSEIKFNRTLLVETLHRQNSKFKNEKLVKQINLLKDKNTFTVCTGHQLCLFTGPLYFIYKIITVINLSEELKKNYPEYDFVPVFWIASEDHDFEEINHVNVFGQRVEWNTGQKGAVGKFKTDSLKSAIEELKTILGESENAKHLLKLFSDAYLENENLAEATRSLVNALFGEDGLVVIDGDDARLKGEFSFIMEDDIFNSTNYPLVNSSIKELENAGYDVQVKPREINVFYLTDNSRLRIEKADEKHRQEIKTNPERFSPNVVLRPLYQQTILPNIAYIGGPAEICYWLEFKKMFEHHKVKLPVLVPRNSVLWIEQESNEKMKKFGIDSETIFQQEDLVIKQFVRKKLPDDLNIGGEIDKLQRSFDVMKLLTGKVDVGLLQSVEADMKKALNEMEKLESKIIRAEKQKHETSVNEIKQLKQKLFPNGELQERYDNFISLYMKHGSELFPILREQLAGVPAQFVVLTDK